MSGTRPTSLNYSKEPPQVLKSLPSTKEICQILRYCVRSNVKELRLGELIVSFFDPAGPKAEIMPQVVQDPESLSKMNNVDRSTLETLEYRLKQDQLEQMAIEDPVEYEKLQLSGDLEDRDAEPENRGFE